MKTYREIFWDHETHVKDLGLFFRQELKILVSFPKLNKLEEKQQLYCDSSLVLCNYKCVSVVLLKNIQHWGIVKCLLIKHQFCHE